MKMLAIIAHLNARTMSVDYVVVNDVVRDVSSSNRKTCGGEDLAWEEVQLSLAKQSIELISKTFNATMF